MKICWFIEGGSVFICEIIRGKLNLTVTWIGLGVELNCKHETSIIFIFIKNNNF